MTFTDWKDLAELASYVTIVLGLPLALYQYRRKTVKEQQDREYGTYNALDEKYLEFVRLCFDHPHLDIFDIPDATPGKLDPTDEKQELIALTMLFSIFERAYLMYAEQSSALKRRQWSGWLEYVTEYCTRENFRKAWRISGNTFDTRFQDFVELTMRRATPSAGIDVQVRPVEPTNAADIAAAVDLAVSATIAGSRLTSNQLTYLLTTREDDIRTQAFLAHAAETRGTLITTLIDDGRIALITALAVQGRSTTAVWHALLREADDCFRAGMLLVEATPSAERLLRQTLPGMGSFREALAPYRYLDGTSGALWLWTTADAIAREELAEVIERLLLRFYAPLRSRTMAQTITESEAAAFAAQLLAGAPPAVPLRGIDLAALPAASAG